MSICEKVFMNLCIRVPGMSSLASQEAAVGVSDEMGVGKMGMNRSRDV